MLATYMYTGLYRYDYAYNAISMIGHRFISLFICRDFMVANINEMTWTSNLMATMFNKPCTNFEILSR